MNKRFSICKLRGPGAGSLALAAALLACPAPAADAPGAVETAQSVFVIPSSSKEGRNPFFPDSTMGMPAPKPKVADPTEAYSFLLNGITSPPRRTAIINGRTFEAGEEGEVRMASGARILIKCEEITTDSARIIVNGEKKTLKLRVGI
jgi:hypothetical protein